MKRIRTRIVRFVAAVDQLLENGVDEAGLEELRRSMLMHLEAIVTRNLGRMKTEELLPDDAHSGDDELEERLGQLLGNEYERRAAIPWQALGQQSDKRIEVKLAGEALGRLYVRFKWFLDQDLNMRSWDFILICRDEFEEEVLKVLNDLRLMGARSVGNCAQLDRLSRYDVFELSRHSFGRSCSRKVVLLVLEQ